ncbi:RluA family pseudouridine synthase [Paenibacillus massiliensis]|uniref:RluA family pseudouridine synthase n=1 Tax=Paenibacillus massiliensis TaxID=225917 RepID=UPI0004711CFA|nr:RluA family pseudouridine synthase [Paenibacillus massiliensis]
MMHESGPSSGISVLYEDNHVLAVEKPVNVPTQEDASGDPDLLSLLKEDLKIRHQKPGNVFLGLIHRLDRPVGGAMIFAKTSKAASRLSEAVRSRSFHKRYLAVVHGKPAPQGRLKDYLLKDSRTNMVQVVRPSQPGAKEAILDYQTLGHANGLSLLLVELHTGRPHQIRVQLSNIGCPLYGDQKYGQQLNKPGQQLALWSLEAGAPHPITKEPMLFRSMPPLAFPWNEWPAQLYEDL